MENAECRVQNAERHPPPQTKNNRQLASFPEGGGKTAGFDGGSGETHPESLNKTSL